MNNVCLGGIEILRKIWAELLSMDKTFLIGLGAQKAGTTWLHHCLAQSPEYDYWFAKEWRILEAFCDQGSRANLKRRMENQIKTRRMNRRFGLFRSRRASRELLEWEKRLEFLQTVEEALPEKFAHFAGESSGKVLGDLSPANGQLNADQLKVGVELARQHGLKTRFALRMRDPLSRLKSGLSHRLKREARLKGEKEIPHMRGLDFDSLARKHSWGLIERSNYKQMIQGVEEVACADDLFCCFFEDAFTQESFESFCGFLGIKPVQIERQPKNVSRMVIELSGDMEKSLVNEMRPIYDFIVSRFGSKVEHLWASSLRLLD